AGWGLSEFRDVIRPDILRADAEFLQPFNTVADLRPGILLHGMLQTSLAVIEEQAADIGEADSVQVLQEFQRPRQRIGGAAPKIALILDRRAARTEIDGARQL